MVPQDEILTGQQPVRKRRKQQQEPEKWSERKTNSKWRANRRIQSDGASPELGPCPAPGGKGKPSAGAELKALRVEI